MKVYPRKELPVKELKSMAASGKMDLPFQYLGIMNFVAHHFGNEGTSKVTEAISKARAAGIGWLQIITTILPLILGIFSGGGTLSLQAIIDAILALLKPAPAKP